MSRVGRNQPCPCGSGHKAKRCCAIVRGPSDADLAAAFLAHAATDAARTLAPLSDAELLDLWSALPDLPRRDLALLVALPPLVSPELNQLFEALLDDDPDYAEPVLSTLLASIDTPAARGQLARALVRLRAAEGLEPRLAAVALVDLASRSQTFIRASLIEAAAIAAGATHTPGGLLIAAA